MKEIDYFQSRPTVLFVMDKWCEANILNGVSEWEGGLLNSLESTGLASEIISFNYDEFWHKNSRCGDDDLLMLCRNKKISLVVVVIYLEPGLHNSVPNYNTLNVIKNEFGIPIVAIWGDIQQPHIASLSQKLLSYVSLNVCTASSGAVARFPLRDNYHYFWVPRDSRIFYNSRETRDILISYVGTPKPSRMNRINYLRASGINVYAVGGERHDHLDVSEYANILRRSKITISFSRSSDLNYHVINARAFEATLCGALLLEEEGVETPQMFTPYVDYVPYDSLDDLAAKAKYYLANENARNVIAESGCRKCHVRYSAQHFWQSVFNRTLIAKT